MLHGPLLASFVAAWMGVAQGLSLLFDTLAIPLLRREKEDVLAHVLTVAGAAANLALVMRAGYGLWTESACGASVVLQRASAAGEDGAVTAVLSAETEASQRALLSRGLHCSMARILVQAGWKARAGSLASAFVPPPSLLGEGESLHPPPALSFLLSYAVLTTEDFPPLLGFFYLSQSTTAACMSTLCVASKMQRPTAVRRARLGYTVAFFAVRVLLFWPVVAYVACTVLPQMVEEGTLTKIAMDTMVSVLAAVGLRDVARFASLVRFVAAIP